MIGSSHASRIRKQIKSNQIKSTFYTINKFKRSVSTRSSMIVSPPRCQISNAYSWRHFDFEGGSDRFVEMCLYRYYIHLFQHFLSSSLLYKTPPCDLAKSTFESEISSFPRRHNVVFLGDPAATIFRI